MLINRSYRLQCLKSTVTFEEQIKTTLILCIKVTWCRPKKNTIDEVRQFFQSVWIWRQRNEAHCSKKLRKQSFRGEINFGIQMQTFPSHCVRENSKTKTWRRFGKNSFQLTLQLNSPKPRRKKEVYPIVFVYIWTIIEGIVLDLCAPLQEFNFFLVSTGQKNSSGTNRATNDHVF